MPSRTTGEDSIGAPIGTRAEHAAVGSGAGRRRVPSMPCTTSRVAQDRGRRGHLPVAASRAARSAARRPSRARMTCRARCRCTPRRPRRRPGTRSARRSRATRRPGTAAAAGSPPAPASAPASTPYIGHCSAGGRRYERPPQALAEAEPDASATGIPAPMPYAAADARACTAELADPRGSLTRSFRPAIAMVAVRIFRVRVAVDHRDLDGAADRLRLRRRRLGLRFRGRRRRWRRRRLRVVRAAAGAACGEAGTATSTSAGRITPRRARLRSARTSSRRFESTASAVVKDELREEARHHHALAEIAEARLGPLAVRRARAQAPDSG